MNEPLPPSVPTTEADIHTDPHQIIEIATTLPDDLIANELAKTLVERRLVACAQASGMMTSTYLWEERLEQSNECRLSLKTTRRHLDAVLDAIRSKHPYSLPEITMRPFEWVDLAYAEWVRASVG